MRHSTESMIHVLHEKPSQEVQRKRGQNERSRNRDWDLFSKVICRWIHPNKGLTGTCLYKADLRGAILEDADLIGVNLRAPDLVRSLVKDVIFCTTTMSDGSTKSSGCTG